MQGTPGEFTYEAKNDQTGSTYTLTNADHGKLVTFDNASKVLVTVPSGLRSDFKADLLQKGAGQVGVLEASTTVNAVVNSNVLSGQWARGRLRNIGSETYVLDGDLGNRDAFIVNVQSDNSGTSASDQFTLPLISGETYDFTVTYDGQETTHNTDVDLTLTFPSGAGNYDVQITGTFAGWNFDNGGDRLKLLSIEQWGIVQWQTLLEAFYGCANLVDNSLDTPDFSAVANGQNAFRGCVLFNPTSIENWDVSSMTTLANFLRDTDIREPDLTGWDVSNVTSLLGTFAACSLFNGDVSNWVTSLVTTMSTTFLNASSFNGDISLWDVGLVTDMSNSFKNTPFNQDISGWNVGSVTNFNEMFSGDSDFNQDISGWNTSAATSMKDMFRNATSFSQDLSSWDVGLVTTMDAMFRSTSVDFDLGGWNVTSLTTAANMFLGVTLSTANYESLLVDWEAQAVQNNVTFHGGNSQYNDPSAAATAHAALIADHTWSITDGGPI